MELTVDIFGSSYDIDSLQHTVVMTEFSIITPISGCYEIKNTGAILLLWN